MSDDPTRIAGADTFGTKIGTEVVDDVVDAVPADIGGPRRVVEVVTHWLEMRSRPAAPAAGFSDGVEIVRAVRPGARFYRYLYDGVGAPWHWYDRRRMSADDLTAIVDHDDVEVHVLWDRGVPAGYVELDRRAPGEVELAYFGLFPEAIGRRLGPPFLRWSIARAWSGDDVARVWVHTCTLDHPAALPVYLAAGFAEYGTSRHRQTIAERG